MFDQLHDRLGGDAWLVGRVTGQEYAKVNAYPDCADQTYPREPWFARRDAPAYGVVLDADGKIAWGRGDIGDDPIVVVLDAVVEAEVRLRQKVDGLARALDVAGSRRPLTAVISGPKPSDTTLEMLGRVCRVLPVGTPTGSTAEQELRDWLAVLMPLPLAVSHGAIADPPGELKKALPADLDEEVRAPLLASASGGARAVQRALRDLLSAPLAGIDMTSEDGA